MQPNQLAGQIQTESVSRDFFAIRAAGEALEDPVIREATEALKAGSGVSAGTDARALFEANKELLTLHELIPHRLVQLLLGAHRGRTHFS